MDKQAARKLIREAVDGRVKELGERYGERIMTGIVFMHTQGVLMEAISDLAVRGMGPIGGMLGGIEFVGPMSSQTKRFTFVMNANESEVNLMIAEAENIDKLISGMEKDFMAQIKAEEELASQRQAAPQQNAPGSDAIN